MLRYDDRVAEQVSAPSGGVFTISASAVWQTLTGLPGAFKTFADVAGVTAGDEFFIEAFDGAGHSALVLVTYGLTTLTAVSVISGSSGGSMPSFSGTVTIFCAAPSSLFMPAFVSAGGTNLATSTVLTAAINVVTGGTGGVSLFVPRVTEIANVSGAAINLYPPSGIAILDLAAGAAWSIGNNDHVKIIPYSGSQWYAA